MNGFEDALADVNNYLRTHEQPIFDGALIGELVADGHDESFVKLALSALTSGGTVIENNGWLSSGIEDRSRP